ncbi:phage distal tail protein, Rcc01695 family [Litorisediminicola beolgyonensis]|uniref:TIGR02217 family protein n=1 Tax=Litorisediminicola beolgyonensis TaxID=1173614 RepID=A0ABW3ZNK9_9RHOB
MSFHEIRFPTRLSFGSVGGPERRTDVVTLANGFEERNTPWAHSRRRYDAGLGMRSLDDIEALVAFFEARQGQLFGFRWKDWSDFKSCAPSDAPRYTDQVIAYGDGVTRVFQLTKTYRSGAQSYQRPIRKPVAGTVVMGVEDVEAREAVHFEIDATTGLVTFTEPPMQDAPITAGFEFDVPVRFDTDAIRTSVASFQAGQAPDVPVIEVRA